MVLLLGIPLLFLMSNYVYAVPSDAHNHESQRLRGLVESKKDEVVQRYGRFTPETFDMYQTDENKKEAREYFSTLDSIQWDTTNTIDRFPISEIMRVYPAYSEYLCLQGEGAWSYSTNNCISREARFSSYRDRMRLRLNALTIYPKTIAEKHRIEGRVVVGFVLNRTGDLMYTDIIDSSGHAELDGAVQQMIQMAQPFESLPDGIKEERVKFAFPVTINLRNLD